jgi:hypothetical protein
MDVRETVLRERGGFDSEILREHSIAARRRRCRFGGLVVSRWQPRSGKQCRDQKERLLHDQSMIRPFEGRKDFGVRARRV